MTLTVQHDDALVDDMPSHPYHTRYFDIVTILPDPPLQRQRQEEEKKQLSLLRTIAEQNKTLHHYNFVSIMSYENAIINAIKDLRDGHKIGSHVSSIKKHMKEYFVEENFPHLKEMNSTTSNIDALKYYNECFTVKDTLFVAAIKSLYNKGILKTPKSNHFSSLSLSSTHVCENWNECKMKLDWIKRNEKQLKEAVRLHRHQQRRHHLKQLVPAARIKPLVSKIRLIDRAAVGALANLDDEERKYSTMELDNENFFYIGDSIFKESSIMNTSLKLGLKMDRMFVVKRKRRKEFGFRKRLQRVPQKKIML